VKQGARVGLIEGTCDGWKVVGWAVGCSLVGVGVVGMTVGNDVGDGVKGTNRFLIVVTVPSLCLVVVVTEVMPVLGYACPGWCAELGWYVGTGSGAEVG